MTIGKVCKALCITGIRGRKAGSVCEDPATHECNGRPCCWIHFKVSIGGSRPIRFEEAPPLRLVGAQ